MRTHLVMFWLAEIFSQHPVAVFPLLCATEGLKKIENNIMYLLSALFI